MLQRQFSEWSILLLGVHIYHKDVPFYPVFTFSKQQWKHQNNV